MRGPWLRVIRWSVRCGLGLLLVNLGRPGAERSLTTTVKYSLSVTDAPASAKRLRLWIPIPKSDKFQTIGNLAVAPKAGDVLFDALYGNAFLYVDSKGPVKLPIEYAVTFDLTRKEEGIHAEAEDPEATARCLAPDRLGAIDDTLRSLASKAAFEERSTMRVARALYDFSLDFAPWNDTGPGVGRGDVAAVVKTKRGDGADLCAFFITLCRAMAIPARYHSGFLLTPDGRAVPHTWAAFLARERGWVPVDLAEARQVPTSDRARRDACFGSLTESRVLVSTGRDIVLTPRSPAPSPDDPPGRSILVDPPPAGIVLTTFASPYAEADDKPIPVKFEVTHRPRVE